ncbi:phosphotransferase [Nonomuraea salmonea]|uniref:phosphotransferase n=1 Tax=Nonomuraea salmonea TaxID=46181 RepID=UPI0031EC7620
MHFQPIERPAQAFQQPVTPAHLQEISRRVFGRDVVEAVELGLGMYNTTYKVTIEGRDRPVVMRFAPEPARQARSERELMRNEYATAPYLAPIAPLMPRIIAADWSHELIGRDYLVQTLLDGVPAPRRPARLPPPHLDELLQEDGGGHQKGPRRARPGIRPGGGARVPDVERGRGRRPARAGGGRGRRRPARRRPA